MNHGFIRLACAIPILRVGDPHFNVAQMLPLLEQAERDGVHVVVFPELGLTGYTCADLFHQPTLQAVALDALANLLIEAKPLFAGLVVVGLPWVVGDQLFNCAAVFCQGDLLGVVPKSFLPNYKEFYERRWFAPAHDARRCTVVFQRNEIPFGTDLLFEADNVPGLTVGVEICEDLWVPIPPSCHQALAGATVLLNLSASNDVIGKALYRRDLVGNQSARCLAAYAYVSAGVHESTTDVVFGGHALIAENGTMLAESQRFHREGQLWLADVDIDRLRADRIRTGTFADGVACRPFRRQWFRLNPPSAPAKLARHMEKHPFVPAGRAQLAERCQEIFQIQVAGLARRLEQIGKPAVALGISGGLDSTLALLVACKTFDLLEIPRTKIHACTMPGFGTTQRTFANAQALMGQLGVDSREIDIRPLCLQQMQALGHQPFGIALEGLSVADLTARLQQVPAHRRHDLVFENVQARMRTSLLMNAGFVIGTGDVSELALGWCTYNGDHMSMYNPNASIPKTLVKFLVGWAAEHEFTAEARRILLDIVATEISPELLPIDAEGLSGQATEGVVGPYELTDFFLFHFMRYGAPPEKILYLAGQAGFEKTYPPTEIRRWLANFLHRFFASQFKRSCLPDGPKVGSISLSPRGDWRMPSDAQAEVWLRALRPTREQG